MSRRPVTLRFALPVAIAMAFLAGTGAAHAQEVRGVVRLEGTGEPVGTALIELVRAADDAIVARTLSGPDGAFRVVAPAAGAYRLRVQRIGLEAVTTESFNVGGTVVVRDVAVGTQPISLAGIAVAGTARCERQGDAPVSVQRLWEEARKTLHSVALLDGGRRVTFQVEQWTRDIDPLTERVRAEETQQRTVSQSQPFLARSVSELMRAGFMERDADSTTYYLPDAGVLLSDEFLEAYCFHAVAADGRLGLAFRPVARTEGAGIRGTLWLDARTAELQQIEFAYTNAPWGRARREDGAFVKEVDVKPHGALYFDRTQNGAWIVSHWFVRMPRFAIRRGRETGRVVYARESGGRVVASSVLPRGWAGRDAGRSVRDGARAPGQVPHVAMRLPHAIDTVTTDTLISERMLARLRADSAAAADSMQEVMLRRAVERVVGHVGSGRVVGQVMDETGTEPVAGAVVEVPDTDVQVVTDARGRFRFEAPAPWFALRVTHVGHEPVNDTITVPAGDVLHLDVRMGVLTLAPITVRARRSGLLADAYWRMARGTGGTFIDAEYIARRNPRVLTDAVRDQPGVRVEAAGSGVSDRGGLLYFRSLCAPQVYLDGVRVTRVENRHSQAAREEAYQEANLVNPFAIELVEIYRGAATLPAEFGGSTGTCGAIVIWTRRGTTPEAN